MKQFNLFSNGLTLKFGDENARKKLDYAQIRRINLKRPKGGKCAVNAVGLVDETIVAVRCNCGAYHLLDEKGAVQFSVSKNSEEIKKFIKEEVTVLL